MFIDVVQNTEEWFNLRLGKITSSNFAKIMSNEGKSFGNPAIEYAEKIALEYVTGKRDEVSSYSNKYMERGKEYESIALDLYEMETLYSVRNGGFYIEDSKDDVLLGDSPDGNIFDFGCVEVKCVIPKTQWKRIKKGGFDLSYKWQIQGHIMIGKKQWCDFVSYCPEMPKNKQLHIFRVERDEEMIKRLYSRLLEFKKIVRDHIDLLN